MKARTVPGATSASALLARGPTAIKRAAEFMDRHPDGIYSRHVRETLVKALGFRVRRERPTEEERQLYERLRSSSEPD
jgi:hypothetical protein